MALMPPSDTQGKVPLYPCRHSGMYCPFWGLIRLECIGTTTRIRERRGRPGTIMVSLEEVEGNYKEAWVWKKLGVLGIPRVLAALCPLHYCAGTS